MIREVAGNANLKSSFVHEPVLFGADRRRNRGSGAASVIVGDTRPQSTSPLSGVAFGVRPVPVMVGDNNSRRQDSSPLSVPANVMPYLNRDNVRPTHVDDRRSFPFSASSVSPTLVTPDSRVIAGQGRGRFMPTYRRPFFSSLFYGPAVLEYRQSQREPVIVVKVNGPQDPERATKLKIIDLQDRITRRTNSAASFDLFARITFVTGIVFATLGALSLVTPGVFFLGLAFSTLGLVCMISSSIFDKTAELNRADRVQIEALAKELKA